MHLLLADIPPPPPEFPLVAVPVPHPVFILIAGAFLAAAVMMIGKRVLREQPAKRSWLNRLAIVVGVLTLLVAIWAQIQYSAYQDRRSNWRGNGPVQTLPQRPESPDE